MSEPGKRSFNWKIGAAGVVTAGVLGFVGVVFGRVIEDTQIAPLAQIREFADVIADPIRNIGEETAPEIETPPRSEDEFASVYFPLQAKLVHAPPGSRRGSGGGIAWDGQDVIVLGHDGSLMAGTEAAVEKIGIAMPDIGYDGYMALMATPEYKNYLAAEHLLRYSNLLYLRRNDRQILLASYVVFHPERACYANAISALERPVSAGPVRTWKAAAGDWRLVHETTPCLRLKNKLEAIGGYASGGAMADAGDGSIYFAAGDFQWDGLYNEDLKVAMPVAQDPEAEHGKILRIAIDTGETSIFSMGHRNPQGIAIDKAGRLFSVEHGMAGGDELNLIVHGRNYGWPFATLGTQYTGVPMPSDRTLGFHDAFEAPVFAFLPSIGIAGLTTVENFHPTWDGDLLASSLKGQMLVRFRIRGERVVFAEEIEIGARSAP